MSIVWEGVFPAVTTKFTKDDQLDIAGFEKNVEAQIAAGVHGIILGGTLGEASSLTYDEKMTITRETKRIAAGRVPVVLNIAEQSTRDALAYVKDAEAAGADGFMLLPPMRYAADARETVTYFGEIAKSTSKQIMIYNNPVDYKIEVTIDMFRELLKYDNIQAVKESTRSLPNLTKMKIEFGDRFKILSGVDNLALESLAMGADGWVAGLVCAFPRETVVIYELAKRGRMKEAIEIYRWFIPLLELDISTKLVQNIKLAETAVGLGTPYVRPPRLELIGDEKAHVDKVIKDALAVRPSMEKFDV
jgi:4-hydroxy-tetrahydrodipicolinate synthase